MSTTALFLTEAETERRRFRPGDPLPVETSLGTISLRVVRDLRGLESPWEELQAAVPCTASQTYDWAKAWTRHVLGPEGREPVIAIGHDSGGALLFLWPFEVGTTAGLGVLKWLSQDHANYNMGLFAPGVGARLTTADILRLLCAVAGEADAAAAIFLRQPLSWDGIPNPFAGLSHQAAPNSGYAIRLKEFDSLYRERFSKRSRGTLNRKERNLAEIGPISYGWAESCSERLALLDTFFAQKARQFAEMGIKDIFDVHARAFYRELALLEGGNPSQLRLGYLKSGETVLAVFSGTLCHKRISIALSSLAESELLKYSPGALLLRHQIREACDQGLGLYDLGVGPARHKEDWCDVVERLFDTFIAFRPQGSLLTLPLSAASRLKRRVKQNRLMWSLVTRLRKSLLARVPQRRESQAGLDSGGGPAE